MSSLKHIDKTKLEKIFEMDSGYVCDFSDRTFGDFVLESTNVDVYTDIYTQGGTSKANRLRAFWEKEPNGLTAKLIEDLLEHWRVVKIASDDKFKDSEEYLYKEGLGIVKELRGGDIHKTSKAAIGVIDEGEDSLYDNVDTEGFDIGIHNKGKRTTVIGGKHTSSAHAPKKWYEKPMGIIILGVAVILIGRFLLYRLGLN